MTLPSDFKFGLAPQPITCACPTVGDPADCSFYHTMEVPGHGIMTGEWDLRGGSGL
jgi:hypothetical protein